MASFLLVNVPDWFEEPPVVEPVDILEGGVLDLVEVAPWSSGPDVFGLVQADDKLRQGVVVGVADGSDR